MFARPAGQAVRLVRFGAVGITGLVVNTLLVWGFTEVADLHYLLSAILATQGSTLWNYWLTDRWVFRQEASLGTQARVVTFLALSNAALVVRGPLIVLLTEGVGIHYLASNLVSLGLLTLVRYGISAGWIWRPVPAGAQGSGGSE